MADIGMGLNFGLKDIRAMFFCEPSDFEVTQRKKKNTLQYNIRGKIYLVH